MSVGMAIAEKWLANRYNRAGFDIFDYRIYAIAGDGCMMEGISSEGASLAGHLQLDNLCWVYDNNHITIGWERYVGPVGRIIGMKTFGGSAPLKELQKKFGFQPERVVQIVKELLDFTRKKIA
jgi:transketolase